MPRGLHPPAPRAGRAPLGDGPADLDLVAERARLASAQADAQEVRNDFMRGLVVMTTDVAAIVEQQFAATRTRLLAIPAQKAMLVSARRTVAEAQSVLWDAITEALTELADPAAVPRRAARGSRRAAIKRLDAAAGEGAGGQ